MNNLNESSNIVNVAVQAGAQAIKIIGEKCTEEPKVSEEAKNVTYSDETSPDLKMHEAGREKGKQEGYAEGFPKGVLVGLGVGVLVGVGLAVGGVAANKINSDKEDSFGLLENE